MEGGKNYFHSVSLKICRTWSGTLICSGYCNLENTWALKRIWLPALSTQILRKCYNWHICALHLCTKGVSNTHIFRLLYPKEATQKLRTKNCVCYNVYCVQVISDHVYYFLSGLPQFSLSLWTGSAQTFSKTCVSTWKKKSTKTLMNCVQ